MAFRIHRWCREPGCCERTTDRSGFCTKHVGNNSYARGRSARRAETHKNDPTFKLYLSVAWRVRFRACFLAHNVICQRLHNGVRCNRPVEILHHIISPRKRPDLFFTPSNVVGVCRQDHPITEGEPEENRSRLSEIYVPTVWPEIRFI